MFILLLCCCTLATIGQTNANFQTQTGIPCIPVLSAAPSASAAGAIYINSTTKIGYRYTGSVWTPICTNPGEIVSPSGRVWMDRNLGAKRVATSSTDYLAYGDLFQWCRGADGHEKINWTSSTTGTVVNGTTSTQSSTTTPGHAKFITVSAWTSTTISDGSLWWNGSVVGSNNPCPAGFHVPTYAEWNAELTYITSTATAYTYLKLPIPGYCHYGTGLVSSASSYFVYHTSTCAASSCGYSFQSSPATYISYINNSFGVSVRCIKDQ